MGKLKQILEERIKVRERGGGGGGGWVKGRAEYFREKNFHTLTGKKLGKKTKRTDIFRRDRLTRRGRREGKGNQRECNGTNEKNTSNKKDRRIKKRSNRQ